MKSEEKVEESKINLDIKRKEDFFHDYIANKRMINSMAQGLLGAGVALIGSIVFRKQSPLTVE